MLHITKMNKRHVRMWPHLHQKQFRCYLNQQQRSWWKTQTVVLSENLCKEIKAVRWLLLFGLNMRFSTGCKKTDTTQEWYRKTKPWCWSSIPLGLLIFNKSILCVTDFRLFFFCIMQVYALIHLSCCYCVFDCTACYTALNTNIK